MVKIDAIAALPLPHCIPKGDGVSPIALAHSPD